MYTRDLPAAAQSDCLPAVEERLRTMGVRFIKTQVEEAGMRVTQVCEAAPMVCQTS